MYAAILAYLAKVYHYYGQNTVIRLAKSVVVNLKDVQSWSSEIDAKQSELERLAALAEAEKLQTVAEDVTDLRNEQRQQDQKSEQRNKELRQILEDLQQPISRIDMQLSDLRDDLEAEKRDKILRAISTIPYAVHHKAVTRDRLRGSGKWLLEKQLFHQWRSESSSSVLWLHGILGSGKTKLASLVIDQLRSTEHVAYFYCMRNPAEPERADCDRILACMVRQLACGSRGSAILDPVRLKYENAIKGLEGFEDQAWTSDESTQVLIQLTNMYPSVILVVDALDEVNPMDRPDLLDALSKIVQESESLVKIFISSRDNMDIVMRLKNLPNLYIHADENSEDINAFVYGSPPFDVATHFGMTGDFSIAPDLLTGTRNLTLPNCYMVR